MRILYLDATRGLFGASRMLLTLLEQVDRSRFSPYVILANDVDDGDLRLVDALRKKHIPTLEYKLSVLRRAKYLNPRGVLFMSSALVNSTMLVVRLIRKYRIDVVQSNTSTVLTGAVAAWITGVPHIWHVHEIFRPSDAKVLPPVIEALSTRIVTVSDEVTKSLVANRPSIESKVIAIKNGIDPAPFRSVSAEQVARLREEWGIAPDEKVMATVGRVGMWKGEQNFLSVAQIVRSRMDKVKFAVVGGTFDHRDFALDELKAKAQEMGMGNDVIVPGLRDDIPVVMNMIDLLVQLPERPEPFGLAAAEAMAAGKPAVVSVPGGLSEVVCDFETGYHVPRGDIEAAAERAIELLSNDRLRLHMGKAASRRVDREFSVKRYAEQFQELYEEVGSKT